MFIERLLIHFALFEISILILVLPISYVCNHLFLFSTCLRERKDIQQLIRVLYFSAYVVALIFLLQFIAGKSFVRGWVIQYPWLSFFGIHSNRNYLAAYFGMMIPMVVSGLIYRILRHEDRLHAGSLHYLGDSKLLFQFSLLIFLTASFFLTGSRTSVFSFVIMVLCFGLLSVLKKQKKKNIAIVLMIGAVLCFILLLWLGKTFLIQSHRILGDLDAYRHLHGRFPIWNNAFQLFKVFPAFGVGLGVFSSAFSNLHIIRSNVLTQHVLNDYLEILTETGLIGFLCIVFGCFFMVVKGIFAFRKTESRFKGIMGAGCLFSLMMCAIHGMTVSNFYDLNNSFFILLILCLFMNLPTLSRRPINDDYEVAQNNVRHIDIPSRAMRGILLIFLVVGFCFFSYQVFKID